ncbi:hypothetical protein EUGRSUZ_G03314 [Eucalyptus grandis]|uniref:Uncharacterized protein n=1 Tax=Eucalyptus grandis TaxID=71139 RepID=A0ACC3K9N9_EUCGR|nr:hypothetical protein EUGRSUZ_G03314 [Eucalyptus grandis]
MLLLILSSLLFLFFLIKFSKRSSKLKHLPPGPKKLPLIGNLHHMIGALPHHRLRDLAQTYGPIFHLQLGQISLVAISSPDLAKEVFKTQELAFAQRPSFSYTEMSIFPSPIFYPFGEEWRQLRKIYVTEFLGSQRVRSFKSIREEETSNLINYIRSLSSSPLNLSKKIHAFTNSIVSKAAIGQNCKQQDEFISAVEEAISFTGGFSDLFVAGSITTSTLIEWAMSELIRNPKVMAKAQAEVRAVLKEKGCLEESELNKLKYLLSIIKESFRLHPPVPLIPREATEEREINGYKVPAGSRILTNVMAIGRDPRHWTDPEKFKPERFLESTMDFIGTNFELLPFGSGRRACPGIALANANIEVTLASLLYHFDWKLPNGEAMEKLDMTEAFAGTVTRMNSLNVIAIPYIPTVAA